MFLLSINFTSKPHPSFNSFLPPADCVENICRCDYQEDFPDFSVKLNYEETAEVLHFHWDMKAPEGKAELKYFVVR